MRLTLILLGCLLSASASAAEIYKWTDEKGRTQYSDRPPPESVEPERVEVETPAAPAPAAEPTAAETDAVAEAAPPDPCTLARTLLQRLEQEPSVRMDLDGDGTEEVLDVNARLQQIQLARETLQQRCGGDTG